MGKLFTLGVSFLEYLTWKFPFLFEKVITRQSNSDSFAFNSLKIQNKCKFDFGNGGASPSPAGSESIFTNILPDKSQFIQEKVNAVALKNERNHVDFFHEIKYNMLIKAYSGTFFWFKPFVKIFCLRAERDRYEPFFQQSKNTRQEKSFALRL